MLGRISRHFGLLGMVMDPKYMRLYGLAEDGHLYMHDIAAKYTRDLGKVDDWDICRTIFADDEGNVYGSYPVARIWKYDPRKDEVIDLPNIRLECDNSVPPRTMSKPMIDRKVIWRVIEWDPVEKVAYGIIGGNSMLFRYDVHAGPEGKIDYIVPLTAPQYWNGANARQIPFATLTLTIANDRRIYFAPTASGSFDYVGTSWDVHDEEAHRRRVPLLRNGRRLHGTEGRPNLLRRGRRGEGRKGRSREGLPPLAVLHGPGCVHPMIAFATGRLGDSEFRRRL